MRRKDREITEISAIDEILSHCMVMRLAMSVDNVPYIVPLNFGYRRDDSCLEIYFHCAKIGKKLDCIANNPHVCFEMDCGHNLVTAETVDEYSYHYKSIVGYGTVEMVEDIEQKKLFLGQIVEHQTGKHFPMEDSYCKNTAIGKISVTEISAKGWGPPLGSVK